MRLLQWLAAIAIIASAVQIALDPSGWVEHVVIMLWALTSFTLAGTLHALHARRCDSQ